MPDHKELRRWRLVSLACLGLFALSLTLLLWASTAAVPIPAGRLTWQGIVDVGAALVLVILCAGLREHAKTWVRPSALRLSYSVATLLPVVMLLAMWVFASRLRWEVLLVGLAWRVWVLLFTLPPAIAAGAGGLGWRRHKWDMGRYYFCRGRACGRCPAPSAGA